MTEPEGLAAALMQLSGHTSQLAQLDDREGRHWQEIQAALTALRAKVKGLDGTLTDVQDILHGLDGLDDAVKELQDQMQTVLPPAQLPGRYYPGPTRQWWALQGAGREDALADLTQWAEEILTPMFGYLGSKLGKCWASHEFCLVQMDWLMELWSVIHLQPQRYAQDVAAQAEFWTRVVPAVMDLLDAETSKCDHARKAPAPQNGLAARRTAR